MKTSQFLKRERKRKEARPRAKRGWTFLQSRSFLGGTVLSVALVLVVAHGLEPLRFKVDEVTLGLLGFASLPFISKIVTTLKAGNVEFSFRDLTVCEQVIIFLDGIATKRQWTFFTPRPGEENLGPAFVVLTEELIKNARADFAVHLRKWLASEDVNQRWFAAEIVGYHSLTELRRALERAPETEDINQPWHAWELNCLWAVSRLDDQPYESLTKFLSETTNRRNQLWVVKAIDQMVDARMATDVQFSEPLKDLVARLRKAEVPRESFLAIDQELRHIQIGQYWPAA